MELTITVQLSKLGLHHSIGHTLPPTSSFTLAALETSGSISNSPCGSSIGEKEITLWINAHGKQDNLFVCYGVMGRGGFVHYIFYLNIYIFSESAHQTHSTEDIILVYFQIFLRVREV